MALALNFALDLDLVLALALDLDFALALVLDLDFALALALALTLALTLLWSDLCRCLMQATDQRLTTLVSVVVVRFCLSKEGTWRDANIGWVWSN